MQIRNHPYSGRRTQADRRTETLHYRNPILRGDYSDPDVIRVGEDFYLTSSSFTYVPGLPILHSRDLVHWEQIGYAAERLPFERYNRPAHKCGTWAPSIRWHNGQFYVYVCLPDEGLLAFTAENPAGPWECHYVKDVCGWIDPCPLFASDGTVWLVHGFAASRAGINNLLFVHRLSDDGLQVLDNGMLVYDGRLHGDVTVEGPKFYERDGMYWILCPAGGVKPGYQLALRSEKIEGPYERRVVLQQGKTGINGPHQGGWVDDPRGQYWFLHFQDVGAYGRICHLQPVNWSDGWPMMGAGGEPVSEGDTGLPSFPGSVPTSDDFLETIGIQWQWQANPCEGWYRLLKPGLRLYAAPASDLFSAGQFLSQLMQSHAFDMDVSLRLHGHAGDAAGIAMMGYTYYSLALQERHVVLRKGTAVEKGRWVPASVEESTEETRAWDRQDVLFRMRVCQGKVSFYYGSCPETLEPIGETYAMTCGGWTGARPGIFAMNLRGTWGGWADIRYVHVHAGHPDDSAG